MRLEASVFGIKGKQARKQIENCKWEAIRRGDPVNGFFKEVYYPGRFKRIYSDAENGIPFFLPSQLTEIYPRPEKYISRLTKCDIAELKLRQGDILLSRSGTIGSVTLVSKTLEGTVFSDDVIRISLKNENDRGFLYTFLCSKIGNTILQSNNYGSVITHIEPEHLSEIVVPNPPDDIKAKINDKIIESYDLRDKSNELIDKATALLVEELHLPSLHDFETEQFDPSAELNTYTVKLSKLAGRLDGSYHVPLAKAIIEHLRMYAAEVTTVGNERISKEIILPGRFKRVYVEEGQGRVFFGGKQIFELDPSNKKHLSVVHHGDRIKKQLELYENMTLITCSGTIGKVALVPKHWKKWAANQHIMRVVPAHQDIVGYLYIFLSSDYGHQLIAKYTYGSVVDEIDDRHVSQVPFPLLQNKSVQDEINNLALRANELRYNAYLLEQSALQIFNDEVISAK
jgi:type I restriction enzyme S subunit